MLIPSDQITTTEVLEWQGLHLLHFAMSSCSQKVRILLDEKQLPWTSHPINLARFEQRTDWFRGINAKAVVPVLVHDGQVYNESNDILRYLDTQFPSSQGSWFPLDASEAERAAELLHLENELHHALKIITFTFVMPGKLMKEQFEPTEVRDAAQRLDSAFSLLEVQLGRTPYLCGERLMLPDIAWFITLHRCVLSGYPISRLPRLQAYYSALRQRPAFDKEINRGGLLPKLIGRVFRARNHLLRSTMAQQLTTQAQPA